MAQDMLRFCVVEKEHQYVDIEVIANYVIVCTLHLSPTEVRKLVRAIVEEMPPFTISEAE